jgi:hypothetical protein
MATRVRVINEGPHHIIVGTPTDRAFIDAGNSQTLEVSEGHPIVVTEYEADMNEISALVLPEGYRQ